MISTKAGREQRPQGCRLILKRQVVCRRTSSANNSGGKWYADVPVSIKRAPFSLQSNMFLCSLFILSLSQVYRTQNESFCKEEVFFFFFYIDVLNFFFFYITSPPPPPAPQKKRSAVMSGAHTPVF